VGFLKLMFKNSDSDSDAETRHTRSGRSFREVPLANLFKQSYRDEGFYNGEEADLIDEEYSESARAEEVETKELRRGEPETSRTAPTVKVSIMTPPVVSATLSSQSNQSNQSTQSIVTSILAHTQSRNLGKSMVNEMRLPIFRGDGSKDLN
jgi:hypothetical protein